MATPAAEKKTKIEVSQIGIVESDKRDKTRTVTVAFTAMHPKYGKYVRKRTVLQVHDEKNESRLGDRVEVAPVRPMSRTKSWALVRIVERSKGRADLAEIGDAAKTA
jgi:small subunit ribosomal protein S17